MEELRELPGMGPGNGALSIQYLRGNAAGSEHRDQVSLTEAALFREYSKGLDWVSGRARANSLP